MSSDTPSAGSTATARAERARPDWVDGEEYPFDSHYLETELGRMHYVDEGEGHPLVMLHGNPTWSFVYRHLIRGLSDQYRCVAPDFFGFGLSDKPRSWSYRVRDHAAVIERFLDELDLPQATLFVQDWGGPTGMHYATERPDAVDSFVVMNTVMWPMTKALHVRAFSRAMGTPVARWLNRSYNVPVDWVMPLWFGDGSHWTPALRRQYRKPLDDPDDREGALVFTRELVGSTPFLSDLWERRRRVAGKPALICWGMQGPLFRTRALRRWEALFPEARTVEYPTAGHFVQEEQGVEMVPEVRRFLAGRSD